ncbi:MAG: GntR family transcriptional regulator [Planctomycetaceae bacterium]|nr:GntR family transcriptional regulator [Planctomycetaceae bacterium]
MPAAAETARTICDAVEDDIVTGKLPPGAKLDEAGLCRRFDVSRTPIREALRILSERGMVELIRNRGAFVVEMTVPQLIEMFEVMAELEGMCGRLFARRITAELRAELESAHQACCSAKQEGDADEYYYRNEAFHDVIYRGCSNNFLAEQAGALRRRLQAYRRMQLRYPKRMRDSLDEHQGIVDAIVAGDEIGAEQRLKNHVLIQGERFTDFVATVAKESQQSSS